MSSRAPAGSRAARRDSRAEARRRARQRAIDAGETSEEREEDAATVREPARRPTLLERILPPAPPLPGKPDPLATYDYRGPRVLGGPATGWYLLTRKPLAWITPGMGWTLAHVLPLAVPPIGFLSTSLEFAAMITAGVLGWQRPWLYGAAAAFFGSLLFGAFVIALGATGRIDLSGTTVDLVLGLLFFALLQSFIGAIAGRFGGYWRRRFAEASEMRRRQQQRRR